MQVAPNLEAGKLVVAQSGCLACHKIGENGNDGPGPNLTDIGDKLLPGAIRRTLENPTAPMPSFRGLPADKKNALVAFLSSLRQGNHQTTTGGANPEGNGGSGTSAEEGAQSGG
jgi:mono/diheme cytochrome c family protein